MLIQERISELITALSLTPNAFAQRVKTPQPVIHSIISGRNSAPRWDTLQKILNSLPELSSEWLMRGIEPMFLDPDKQRTYEAQNASALTIGDITQAGKKSKIMAGDVRIGHNESQGEITQLRSALTECQEERKVLLREKSQLELELRGSKDKIISLLERGNDRN